MLQEPLQYRYVVVVLPKGRELIHGVVLDFSDKPDGTKLTVKDFEEALSRIQMV